MSSKWPSEILAPQKVAGSKAPRALPPLSRFKCDCCRKMCDKKEMRRQMKFVPVSVCTGCVSKMEAPE